jgi:hypothetical protein
MEGRRAISRFCDGGDSISQQRRHSVSHGSERSELYAGIYTSNRTPIGHQCNTWVLSPGRYRFGDYARPGVPLSVTVILSHLLSNRN